MTTTATVRLETGVLDFQAEPYSDGTALQVDGNDLVHISDIADDGSAHIIVFTSSDPDATVLFEGTINVRQRRDQFEENTP